MKTRNTIIFAIVIVLVAFFAYTSICGLSIGNFTIDPISEDLELGLDLKGGVYVVLEAQTDITGTELDRKMKEAKLIIEERVNGLGVSEPNITIESGNRIRVELAGLKDPQEAIDLIGKTALLQFVDAEGKVLLTGQNVKEAEAILYENKPAVSLKFDSEGAKIFKEETKRLSEALAKDPKYDTSISIVLDGKTQSMPYVSETISSGESVISGNFTTEKAANLATVIRAGALPVELKEMEVSAIGPTLGLESFDKSVKAALIGIILIFIFMIAVYRLPGIIASIALSIYILIVLSFMIAIHAKLTLPGIAGLILSIGMAVDANVVIFERIKEEIKMGKTTRVAVKSGFKRALTSIIDANVTTMISGLVLFYFGTGMIKGFAVTLIIGLVVSVLTAVVITRALLNLVISMGIGKSHKLFGVKEVKNEN
ncbi:protein translocase subunit SecD [Sedimentibacter sp. zth1]|uniref:protein translocase subunit SecD n=1 Tax=Sedimentibacter sp. zth1 TaxID=2816908 RepID=UPI001A932DDC|nr:protein translocase subunit SecD [Sedimentibacter sp. zth1]QSX06328.1 protein translocase subunit SecD [Sedimentibacter sp. zth1]